MTTPVFLSGESSWTEVPGGLQSMGLQRIGHDCVTHTLTQAKQRSQNYYNVCDQNLVCVCVYVCIYIYFFFFW